MGHVKKLYKPFEVRLVVTIKHVRNNLLLFRFSLAKHLDIIPMSRLDGISLR